MKNTIYFILGFVLWSTLLSAQTNTFPSSGNVGIGTTSPAAQLSFDNVNNVTDAVGITWHNPGPLDYGIYRTAGPWSGPNYQQLKINFTTGIILNPGSTYGKSFVDIQGGGLRVSSGSVGIGTTAPNATLHVVSNTNAATDNTVKFSAPAIGGSAGHIHWGTTGDWYIRSAHQSGKVIIQDYVGGNVGIGTSFPGGKLEINQAGGQLKLTGGTVAAGLWTSASDLLYLADWNTGTKGLAVNLTSGNIGIGTSSPNEKLTVNGTIYGKEVKVDLSVPGPDYVFEKDDKLPSLQEVQAYIEMHKHLPEVPSAKEMEENGINVGEMNMILLKKMEDLTLYMIELKKENEEIKKKLKMK